MVGQVWEWMADCRHDSYAGAPDDGRAWTWDCSGGDSGEDVVVRGGFFEDGLAVMRAGKRGFANPAVQTTAFGTRCVREVQP